MNRVRVVFKVTVRVPETDVLPGRVVDSREFLRDAVERRTRIYRPDWDVVGVLGGRRVHRRRSRAQG